MKQAQGDIWWADLPLPAGRRPVLIMTRSDAISRLTRVTIAPLTRTLRHIDSEVILSPEDGVPSICAISLDNLLTIHKSRLNRRIVRLDRRVMSRVFDAVRFAFGMPR